VAFRPVVPDTSYLWAQAGDLPQPRSVGPIRSTTSAASSVGQPGAFARYLSFPNDYLCGPYSLYWCSLREIRAKARADDDKLDRAACWTRIGPRHIGGLRQAAGTQRVRGSGRTGREGTACGHDGQLAQL